MKALKLILCLGAVSANVAFAALAEVEDRTRGIDRSRFRPQVQEQQPAQTVEVASTEASAATDNPTLSLLKRIDFLQQEVQELRGKFEEQSYELEQMHKRQKDLYLDLDKRIRAEGANPVGGVSSMSLSEARIKTQAPLKGAADHRISAATNLDAIQPTAADIQNAPLSEQDKAAEKQAYDNAYKLIQNKNFTAAETALRSLLKTFPGGQYTANVHYWLGELYLVQGQLALAQTQFENVFQNYPAHQKAADALLKLGYVQYSKGQWQESSDLLGQVKTKFPNTSSARLADSRLQKMRQEGRI